MKRARIQYQGDVLNVTIDDAGQLIGEDGKALGLGVDDDGYTWLSPVAEPGTI